jgi:hypothetical protein
MEPGQLSICCTADDDDPTQIDLVALLDGEAGDGHQPTLQSEG